MGRRSHDVSIFYRVLQQTGSNQTSGVSHVDHQQGTHLVGNLTHTLVVPFTAVGTATTDNQLGLVLQGQLLHLVVIHTACLLVQVVADGVVDDTRSIDMRTMGEVTTVVEVQTHEGIAWFQHGQQHGCISLGTRVGLYVGILCVEEFADAVDGELLHFVHHLATTIVTVARITLGILVGKVRSHGFHHLVTHEILTGNQLNAFQLALMLFLDQLEDCVVSVHFCPYGLIFACKGKHFPRYHQIFSTLFILKGCNGD